MLSLLNKRIPRLWKANGGYTTTINFNPELDSAEFGNQYGIGKYTAEFKFDISDEGIWDADFKWNFIQHWEYEPYKEENRQGPFFAQDFSNMTSNAAVRARKLSKPVWGIEGRTGKDYSKLFDEENTLNKSINWSFEYSYKSQGNWSNYDNYSVDIPSQSSINVSTDKIIKVYKKEEIL